jgi:hypothetical protein
MAILNYFERMLIIIILVLAGKTQRVEVFWRSESGAH